MYALPVADRWYSSFSSKKTFSSPLKRDWCVCIPLPFWANMGFGINVA